MSVDQLLSRLRGVKRSGRGWSALCPAHEDTENSLSVGIGDDGRILVKCFAGCPPEAIVKALGLEMRDLFTDANRRRDGRGEGGHLSPPKATATVQPPTGLTLADYATAKKLPVEFLRQLGLNEMSYLGRPAVRIPYLNEAGAEVAIQFRLALDGDLRFRWKTDSKSCPYGLWRLGEARAAGFVVLVEGPSDAQTLWIHQIPALGLPSASTWREEWAEYLDGITTIYVVIEPDQGGQTIRRWLATSRIRTRARLVTLGEAKDPSALHLADPAHFKERWQAALNAATPWTEQTRAETETRMQEAWARCATLAREPRILERFAEDLHRHGVAGESRAAKLLYLILMTRYLDRPVSAVLKGPSSAGKNFLAQHVLNFFPPSACYALSAMSERALAYSEEPLAHRFLVIYEAVGLQSDFASYLVRSLLSEGRVRYETVEKTRDGLRPRLIEREGPTGLLVTTTAVKLHDENETRLLSIPITDTPEQTKAVLKQTARRRTEAVDLERWHALQEWLALVEHRAVIPYAEVLADLIPPVAVRLRRDFGAILSLIEAHGILHQAGRDRDEEGCVVATIDDYAVVRELAADLVAEGVEVTVSKTIREVIEAVGDLSGPVTVAAVARRLKLDKSATWRRIQKATEDGYLKNLEDRNGRAARLVLGEPLPDEQVIILPPANNRRLQGCTVAGETEGIQSPPLPPL